MEVRYADDTLGQFLDLVAARQTAPGGGAVAAVTVSLAASLVAMAARFAGTRVPDSDLVADAADDLRRRAADLADDDARAYQAVIDAYASSAADLASRRTLVRAALTRASEVPLEVGRLGAETAELGARLAVEGNPRLEADAVTAVLVVEAAVRSAAHLVAVNVEVGGCETELVRQAEAHVCVAGAAVRRVGGEPPRAAP